MTHRPNKPKTTTTSTTTSTTTKSPAIVSPRKKAVCTGINNYVGTQNDLQGCVNDAREWSKLLNEVYGFKVTMLLDEQVTYEAFTESLGNMIADSRAGENLVGTYSGHGTNVPDQNEDEEDGRDEALVLYDAFLIDDSIREMFQNLHPEATLTFISDSCHSGSVTRAFLSAVGGEEAVRPRFLPPQDDLYLLGVRGTNVKSRIFYPETGMKEILIAGCLPTEYSYDAYIGGKYRGAMSYYAVNILRKQPAITYENFYAKLREILPSSAYPQTSQLESSDDNKKKIMFQ